MVKTEAKVQNLGKHRHSTMLRGVEKVRSIHVVNNYEDLTGKGEARGKVEL